MDTGTRMNSTTAKHDLKISNLTEYLRSFLGDRVSTAESLREQYRVTSAST
ncbi:MAG: hypothetical protein GY820_17500 [Gammaproteobacteria bacterium]|nr:hypothetical protein [Gammaproteobacteria bacterium]